MELRMDSTIDANLLFNEDLDEDVDDQKKLEIYDQKKLEEDNKKKLLEEDNKKIEKEKKKKIEIYDQIKLYEKDPDAFFKYWHLLALRRLGFCVITHEDESK